MVYMGGSRAARNAASIVNRPTCGGNKKAGLPASVGRSTAETVALRQTSQTMALLKDPVSSTTCSSRPVGSLPGNWRKC